MKVIAVAGQLGFGKDVLADYLVEQLNEQGSNWIRSAFANAVKQVYQDTFGVDRDFIERWKRNPEPPPGMLKNVRQSLQFIGDGFRQIKADIWIEVALRDESKALIISDSRYINEARHVAAKGGINIVLYRPGFLNDDPNPSESQIRPIVEFCDKYFPDGPLYNIDRYPDAPEGIEFYDLFIRNDGTIEEFYGKVDEIVLPYVMRKYGA